MEAPAPSDGLPHLSLYNSVCFTAITEKKMQKLSFWLAQMSVTVSEILLCFSLQVPNNDVSNFLITFLWCYYCPVLPLHSSKRWVYITETKAEIIWTGVLIEPRHPAVKHPFWYPEGVRRCTGIMKMMSHEKLTAVYVDIWFTKCGKEYIYLNIKLWKNDGKHILSALGSSKVLWQRKTQSRKRSNQIRDHAEHNHCIN